MKQPHSTAGCFCPCQSLRRPAPVIRWQWSVSYDTMTATMNKLCTRTLCELDGTPHVRVDEYMKHRLQNKLIRAILKDSL